MSTLSRRELIATPLALAQGAQPKPSIWDVHCHLISGEGSTPEERMAYLIRFMDRLGIERVMLSLGYPLLADPSPEQLRELNGQVLKAIARYPDRAFGFVYLNPNHLAFSLEEFDRCVRDGPMVGVKLWVAKRCNAPELDSIVERAAAIQAPILQHTWFKLKGNLPGESTPNDLAELAMRHPKAVLIDAHTGGDWERGIRAIRPVKNIATCVAGFDPTAGVVEMAVRELGAERVMFGSDAAGRSFASQLGKVMGAGIPESSRRLVLRENLRRVLAPILRAKGVRA
ncbi:MAG: amidohydrolase family protein [Bryobacterales bacterium]|nr:amidohydrolase family protein [Bryobacterales bacterium]